MTPLQPAPHKQDLSASRVRAHRPGSQASVCLSQSGGGGESGNGRPLSLAAPAHCLCSRANQFHEANNKLIFGHARHVERRTSTSHTNSKREGHHQIEELRCSPAPPYRVTSMKMRLAGGCRTQLAGPLNIGSIKLAATETSVLGSRACHIEATRPRLMVNAHTQHRVPEQQQQQHLSMSINCHLNDDYDEQLLQTSRANFDFQVADCNLAHAGRLLIDVDARRASQGARTNEIDPTQNLKSARLCKWACAICLIAGRVQKPSIDLLNSLFDDEMTSMAMIYITTTSLALYQSATISRALAGQVVAPPPASP